ncbi:MAG: hypothetical protein WAT78_02705 [Rhizobiaceae bacterium]
MQRFGWGPRVYKFLLATIKIGIASVMTGAGLSALDLSANDVLREIGLTPETIMAFLERGAVWAIPNLVLGLMVVLPIWFVVSILRPPRG